jgi:hypothetical protein
MEVTDIVDELECVVEYSADAVAGMVPLSPETVAEITEGDESPKFATFVIESGWSKSKRFWGADLFNDVAEQINKGEESIVGYLGHIKPEDDAYSFPEIQLQWIKARVQKTGDRARLAVKAYVLPETKGRDYLRRRLVKTVSWRGKAIQVPYEKGVRVSNFQIESIDLSRPRKAGMSARMVGALTSEMDEGGNSVKPEEIAALQENELRAHNPAIVKAIEDSAKAPLATKIGEMETAKAAVEPVVGIIPELRKLLGLDENTDDVTVLSKAVAQIKEAGKSVRDTLLAKVLSDKKFNDPMLKRLITSEMSQKEFDVTGDDDADKKAVTEMVNSIVDGDADLKKLVSEMEGTPPAIPGTADRDLEGNRNKGDWKPGFSSSNVRVKAVR